jgi:hypothetical protein
MHSDDFAAETSDEPTRPQPNSLDPGDPICAPVLVERRRRKTVDLEIDRRLTAIQAVVIRSAKFSKFSAIGLAAMVIFASLEYLGILGHDRSPIWASAVIDGVKFAFGNY